MTNGMAKTFNFLYTVVLVLTDHIKVVFALPAHHRSPLDMAGVTCVKIYQIVVVHGNIKYFNMYDLETYMANIIVGSWNTRVVERLLIETY